jgi:hypothetical protein
MRSNTQQLIAYQDIEVLNNDGGGASEDRARSGKLGVPPHPDAPDYVTATH